MRYNFKDVDWAHDSDFDITKIRYGVDINQCSSHITTAILYDSTAIYKPDVRVDAMGSTSSLYQQIPLSSYASANAFSWPVKIVRDKVVRNCKTRVDDVRPFDR